MKIVILHLDLGIGGAEQLIVTIAKCIQELGHDIEIVTSHHDINHCFEETKPNGFFVFLFVSLN
jgi:alpha-1,3/alpha-1,6-mannosyltransferase